MRQKFKKLTFVKINDKMPDFMFHFPAGKIAIVDGTYSQIHGGTDIKSYSLFLIKGKKVINCVAWYDESQLIALPDKFQDRDRAEQMIEDYRFKNK